MPRRRLVWILATATPALVLAGWLMTSYARSAAFILDVAGVHSTLRRVLPGATYAVSTSDLAIPTRDGPITARIYRPDLPSARAVIVFPGVHGGGLDEPRLVTFSQRLAATGLTVIAAPLPDLRAYRITPRSVDEMADLIANVSSVPDIVPTGRVGVVGISFSGGLAIVAADRPNTRDHVATVVSLGGHGDLPRVLRYLCTGTLADGTHRAPEDYAVDVLVFGAAEWLVPPNQVGPFRAALTLFLDGASADGVDAATAQAKFAAARAAGAALAEPARSIVDKVVNRQGASLGPQLLPFVDELGGDPSLSPERSPAPRAPVFLLHGADDDITPSSETLLLAAYLRAQHRAPVEALVTPALSHVAVRTTVSWLDAWRLVRFWRDALLPPR